MPCQQLFERGKRVRRDVERRHLDILEKVVEMVRVEDNFGQGLEPDALAQHCAAVQRDFLMFIA